MQKSQVLKTAIYFGLLIGAACIFFFLVLNALGFTPLGNKKLPDIGINLILTAGAFWYFKSKNRGYIHTWEGISIGYLSNIIGVLITASFIFLYLNFIDHALLQKYISEMIAMLQKSKEQHITTFGEQSFNSLVVNIKKTTNFDIFLDEITKKSILMIIPIFILAAIFRKIEPATTL